MVRITAIVLTAFSWLAVQSRAAAAEDSITIGNPQTVGISGFEESWNRSFAGSRTADAVHRSVLIRFPRSADIIARRLSTGGTTKRVEVVFDYESHETTPSGYTFRDRDEWRSNHPRWHYVGWALRQPWTTDDRSISPTFNAYIQGAGFWAKCGARDEERDRYPTQFGPAEVSRTNTQGTMDVTELLTDDTYGATLGERLRRFEEQGLIIRKWETYDMRYNEFSAYEWAVATGGHGLTFKDARLVVYFGDGQVDDFRPPPPRSLRALAARLSATREGGAPTAVMPNAREIALAARNYAFRKPDWMPDWQWLRVQELRRLGGSDIAGWSDDLLAGSERQYRRMVRNVLATLPRYWKGWGVQDDLILWYLYGDALPEYVRDHIKAYWDAWLYPDLPNNQLMDPQGEAKLSWWREHQDWRGRFSFFRSRYTQGQGTMNFNHTANMGALLGGHIIGAEYPIEDGRLGLERMLLRFWSYLDGTSQEMLDDYYFSITLSGQKMFADFGPTHLDRLMGDMILDRAMELLISSYHPHVRRVVGASGRVRMSNVLGFEQEGIYSALHTLSRQGVLFHTNSDLNARQSGMYLFGYDFPPGRAALQSITKPWAPEWATYAVDEKPLPYEITAAETTRNNFTNPPLWRRAYLGRYYGLASQDIKGGSVDIIAQWNPSPRPATDAAQLGTLTLRYSINEPNMSETSGGIMPYSGGTAAFQHRNRIIVATKPRTERERTLQIAGGRGVSSLASTIALWNFRERMDWRLYVDGRPVTALPVKAQAGQLITLHDGSTFVGIIPLPATDLGRDEEIVIERGSPKPLGDRHGNTTVTPALLINSYNLKQNTPIASQGALWDKITTEAYGGFVIEMGDMQEYQSFEEFQLHMQQNTLETEWEADRRLLHIRYRSGDDLMEMGFCTDYPQSDVHYGVEPGQHRRAIPYRRINGEHPYLPGGIDRDTTLTQQGTTGRLEKNGAVLVVDNGRKAYLQTEPVTGTYTGYNPFPDLTEWSLTVPGGIEVRADGRIGLARIAVRPGERKLWIDNAYKPAQIELGRIAERVLVFGLDAPPIVTLNGRKLDELESIEHDGRTAYVIPLM